MTEEDAKKLAQAHIKTERSAHQAELIEQGGKRVWTVSFAGDGKDPVIVGIDADSSEVLQVFEPLKMMMQQPKQVREIITEPRPLPPGD